MSIVQIARCPEHGLHGEREACFVCGGPVEQVPHVTWDHAHEAIVTLYERLRRESAQGNAAPDLEGFEDMWTDAMAATTPDLSSLGAMPDAPPPR